MQFLVDWNIMLKKTKHCDSRFSICSSFEKSSTFFRYHSHPNVIPKLRSTSGNSRCADSFGKTTALEGSNPVSMPSCIQGAILYKHLSSLMLFTECVPFSH